MLIFDISMSITPQMPVYKNQTKNLPVFQVVKDYGNSGTYESSIAMNMHTGTHIDCPRHMFPAGGLIGDLDLNQVICRCSVWDLTGISHRITRNDLISFPIRKENFVIFKTRNSAIPDFDPEFVYLEQSGAQYLREKEVIGVGIDSLGIERNQPGHPTHRILFDAGIVILEGLRLQDVAAGEYLLVAAPLKIIEAEAAPVRAILLKI